MRRGLAAEPYLDAVGQRGRDPSELAKHFSSSPSARRAKNGDAYLCLACGARHFGGGDVRTEIMRPPALRSGEHGGEEFSERETGLEPATLSLGS
jgi:hypothetical protein